MTPTSEPVTAPAPIVTTAPVLWEAGRPITSAEVVVAPPGLGEVRVKLSAAGVCHSCLHAVDGTQPGIPMPVVLGDEGAGVVEAVGPGCQRIRVGDHVVISWAPSCGTCRFCLSGRPVLCLNGGPVGHMRDGTTRFSVDGQAYHYGPATIAPYTVVDESAAIPVVPDVPLDRAVLVGCSVATGVGAVVNTARARFGSSVAVFGCGGIGLNAIQGGLLVGARRSSP